MTVVAGTAAAAAVVVAAASDVGIVVAAAVACIAAGIELDNSGSREVAAAVRLTPVLLVGGSAGTVDSRAAAEIAAVEASYRFVDSSFVVVVAAAAVAAAAVAGGNAVEIPHYYCSPLDYHHCHYCHQGQEG